MKIDFHCFTLNPSKIYTVNYATRFSFVYRSEFSLFLEGFACFSRAILWSKFYYAIVILTLWNCNVHGSIIMRENVSICVIQSVSGTQFHLPTRLAELKSTIYFDVISQMMSSIECNFKLIRCIKNELLT